MRGGGLGRDQGREKEETKGGRSIHDRRGTVSIWQRDIASNKGYMAEVRIAQKPAQPRHTA